MNRILHADRNGERAETFSGNTHTSRRWLEQSSSLQNRAFNPGLDRLPAQIALI